MIATSNWSENAVLFSSWHSCTCSIERKTETLYSTKYAKSAGEVANESVPSVLMKCSPIVRNRQRVSLQRYPHCSLCVQVYLQHFRSISGRSPHAYIHITYLPKPLAQYSLRIPHSPSPSPRVSLYTNLWFHFLSFHRLSTAIFPEIGRIQ